MFRYVKFQIFVSRVLEIFTSSTPVLPATVLPDTAVRAVFGFGHVKATLVPMESCVSPYRDVTRQEIDPARNLPLKP